MTFKELKLRLSMPTPDTFRKIGIFGRYLTGLSVIILGLHSQFPGLHIPDILNTVAGYLAAAGFVLAGVAALPVEDSTELKKKLNPLTPVE